MMAKFFKGEANGACLLQTTFDFSTQLITGGHRDSQHKRLAARNLTIQEPQPQSRRANAICTQYIILVMRHRCLKCAPGGSTGVVYSKTIALSPVPLPKVRFAPVSGYRVDGLIQQSRVYDLDYFDTRRHEQFSFPL